MSRIADCNATLTRFSCYFESPCSNPNLELVVSAAMTKKRKLTSPAAAKMHAEVGTFEEEASEVAPVPEFQEEQHSSGADADPQIHDGLSADLDVGVAEAGNGVGNAHKGGVDEDDENERDPASILKLLEPFPKDHIIEILRDAAVKHPDLLSEIHRIAGLDPAHRKIFVHGLGWDTSAEILAAAFRQYGEIEDCNAVMEKATGKSKGYGFILFKHRIGARRALKEPQKKIGNRMTSCQLASAGPVLLPAPQVSDYSQRKIFVSNVGAELDPQKLLQFFSKYGEVEEGPLGLDKVTGKPKGFALFVYKTIDSAKKALEEPHKNFEGYILHCQKAIDGPKPNKPVFQFLGSGAQYGRLHHGAGEMFGSNFPRSDNPAFFSGVRSHLSSATSAGHLMAPSGYGMGFNQSIQPATAMTSGLDPALGQALTALIATQGSGLGLTNILGNLLSSGVAGTTGTLPNSSGHGLGSRGYGGGGIGVGESVHAGMMGGYDSHGHAQGGYGSSSTVQGRHGQTGGLGPYLGR